MEEVLREFLKDEMENFIPDFSKYNSNNFKITNNNDCLNELEEKRCRYLCLNTDGDLMLRVSQNNEFKIVSEEEIALI